MLAWDNIGIVYLFASLDIDMRVSSEFEIDIVTLKSSAMIGTLRGNDEMNCQ